MIRRWWKTVWPWLITRTAQGLIKVVLWTCRIEYVGTAKFFSIAQKQACVLMLWHDRLALVAPLLLRVPGATALSYTAFVSASRDGQLVNEICASYPNVRIISVSHDGRHHALRALIQQLQTKQEVLLITPDGPRGPRHQVKPGLAMAARKATAPVIPFSWSTSRFWQLRTWDRMMFPKPFSKIVVTFGTPLTMTGEDDDQRLEDGLQAAST